MPNMGKCPSGKRAVRESRCKLMLQDHTDPGTDSKRPEETENPPRYDVAGKEGIYLSMIRQGIPAAGWMQAGI
ncbi:MAG: hypothetical protein ACLFVU_08290 [Phycisphaerae bacterium]